MVFRIQIFSLWFLLSGFGAIAQQVPDPNFNPEILKPAYPNRDGTAIYIDAGHNNFHTKNGRYQPFAKLLEKDGYVLKSYEGTFQSDRLKVVGILVIANALHDSNVKDWSLPNPSAFTDKEIKNLKAWVQNGGSLFLIADHMPFPGAAEELAAAFGFKFLNGFNIDVRNPAYFRRMNGTIAPNSITNGRDSTESIQLIPNTEGQAFHIPDDANPILIFGKTSMILFPEKAWQFTKETPIAPIEGLVQGAFMKFGGGRIAVFGEASMFTAQINQKDGRKMGMNKPDAADNYKLLLNTIHWLDGLID